MKLLRLSYLLLFFFANSSFAIVIYVDDDAPAGGDGTSWGKAFKHLQDALIIISEKDEVRIAEGTYRPDYGANKKIGDKNEYFKVIKNITICGGYIGNESNSTPLGQAVKTILTGEIANKSDDWATHLFIWNDGDYFDDSVFPTPKIKNIYLQNSSFSLVQINKATPIFENCIFKNHRSAVYIGLKGSKSYSKEIEFIDCNFTENKGGAVLVTLKSDLISSFENCVFEDNENTNGAGGINAPESVIDIRNSKFIGNSGTNGGAIRGKATIDKTLFFKNTATLNGGAAFIENTQFNGEIIRGSWIANFQELDPYENFNGLVTNSIFIENTSKLGGGIYKTSPGSVTLKNCLFYKNNADEGAALFTTNSDPISFSTLNSIFWNNFDFRGIPTHGTGHHTRGNAIKVLGTEDTFNYPAPFIAQNWQYNIGGDSNHRWDSTIITDDPKFFNENDYDGADNIWFTEDDGLRLQHSSIGIDYLTNDKAGNNIGTDIAGDIRIQGETIDFGPYEYGGKKATEHSSRVFISNPDPKMGQVSGDGLFINGESTTLNALPNEGFTFVRWEGDLESSLPNINLKVTSNISTIVRFDKDIRDNDGDGLSNHDEIIIYKTDQNSSDTDNDGLYDFEEINNNLDPTSSDAKIVSYMLTKNNSQKYIQMVLDSPENYGLVSKDTHDKLMRTYPMFDSNSSPYTSGWYYQPNRGWLFTNNNSFPYIFDQNTSNWLYFESGNTKPRFYEYGNKIWIELSED